MKRMLALFLMLTFVAAAVAPAVAQDGTVDKIKRTGVLTIGTRTGSPPFAYVNKNNEWVGFTIDLVEQLIVPALAKDGMTMMVVTHEMGFARRVAHRVVFMDAGQVVEENTPASFFAAPKSERSKEFLSKILTH